MKKMVKNKKAIAWFWLVPMVVPLWLFMFGQIKWTFFTDWGDIMNKIMILGGVIVIVLIMFRKRN